MSCRDLTTWPSTKHVGPALAATQPAPLSDVSLLFSVCLQAKTSWVVVSWAPSWVVSSALASSWTATSTMISWCSTRSVARRSRCGGRAVIRGNSQTDYVKHKLHQLSTLSRMNCVNCQLCQTSTLSNINFVICHLCEISILSNKNSVKY